jgi:UDP:flavonoid glycosyltransferase YjiC (YdhE family)
MTGYHREHTIEVAVKALARTKQRGLIITGTGGRLTGFPAQICAVESVPHDWLFPRVTAVVHHGGAGTTAAALRAGVPSVVVPGFADQPFWASRVYELGAGPSPIPRRYLSTARLEDAIRRTMSDRSMQERAAELGRRVRAENGVATAVQVFRRHFAVAAA